MRTRRVQEQDPAPAREPGPDAPRKRSLRRKPLPRCNLAASLRSALYSPPGKVAVSPLTDTP